jgi:hypothetical protein
MMQNASELYRGVMKLIRRRDPVEPGHTLEKVKALSKPKNSKEIEKAKSDARLALLQGS